MYNEWLEVVIENLVRFNLTLSESLRYHQGWQQDENLMERSQHLCGIWQQSAIASEPFVLWLVCMKFDPWKLVTLPSIFRCQDAFPQRPGPIQHISVWGPRRFGSQNLASCHFLFACNLSSDRKIFSIFRPMWSHHGQDLATQIRWWDFYKWKCRQVRKPAGIFLNPEFAEWISGASTAKAS